MDNIYKEKLKETLEIELVKVLCIKNEFEAIKRTNIIEEFIDDLCDISEIVVYPLTEQETFVFRKMFGIYDDGVFQNSSVVALELDYSVSRIEQIVNKSLCSLYGKRILNSRGQILSLIKMTSADIDGNEKVKNIEINSFRDSRLGGRIFSVFEQKNVFTFGDLLTFSIQDLKLLFDDMELCSIVDMVHCLGFKFIDELSDEEKQQIIFKSSPKKLMNSSISWIEMNESSYRNFMCMKVDNLNKLVQMINNNWFYFVDLTIDTQIYETDIYELLRKKIGLIELKERFNSLISKKEKLQDEIIQFDVEINNILEQIKDDELSGVSKKIVLNK